MAFTVPGLGSVFGDLLRDYANRLPGASLAKKTINRALVGMTSMATALLLRSLKVIYRDLWPDTAARDELLRHGSIRNITLRPATPAKKADALRVVGTVGAAYTSGDVLTHSSGLRYELAESGVVGVGGFTDVDVIGIDTGRQTRLAAGEVLTFVAPAGGINSRAELQLDLDEDGDDEESEGEYRVRVLDRFAAPGMGGNADDFRQWAKEVTGVFEAYVYPLRQGLGSIHVAALKSGTGAARLLSLGERDELQDYLNEKKPDGYEDCYVLEVTAEARAIEVVLEAEDGHPWDWDDSTPLVVLTWTALTRTLQFTGPRPADMQVGDRLVYQLVAGTLNAGGEQVIESFVSTDQVVLAASAELTATPPIATINVYAGGALTEPVRASLQAHVDSLGPGRLSASLGIALGTDFSAGGSYWTGSLLRSKLGAAADDVDGVVDYDIIAPPAPTGYFPTNIPPALQVAVAIASQIIARAKH
jgi:uncharacterized phage protein gp47/JayE